MLENISLTEFKSFRDLDNLEVKPITILCGANSSGKSSLIKSLLILKQSFESEQSRNSLLLNGIYANNGMFDSVIHKGSGDKFNISNTFSIRYHERFNFFQDYQSYRLLNKIYKKVISRVEVFTILFSIDIVKFNETKRKRIDNIIDRFEIIIKTDNIISRVELQKHKGQETTYTIKWFDIPTPLGEKSNGSIACTCHFSGFKLLNIYSQNDDYSQIMDILPNIVSFFQIISDQYRNLSYIGPLREAPARRYIYEEEIDDIGIKGENAPYILSNTNYMLNEAIFLIDENDFNFYKQRVSFRDAVKIWSTYIGIEEFNFEENDDILKLIVANDNIDSPVKS